MSPLLLAANHCSPLEVVAALGRGDDVNEINEHGTTALHVAVSGHDIPVIRILLLNGANVDAHERRRTPLHEVCTAHLTNQMCDHSGKADRELREVLQILVKAGADINWKNPRGETALRWCSEWGQSVVVAELLSLGADPNIPDHKGVSPLAAALKSRHDENAAILVRAGAVRTAVALPHPELTDRAKAALAALPAADRRLALLRLVDDGVLGVDLVKIAWQDGILTQDEYVTVLVDQVKIYQEQHDMGALSAHDLDDLVTTGALTQDERDVIITKE